MKDRRREGPSLVLKKRNDNNDSRRRRSYVCYAVDPVACGALHRSREVCYFKLNLKRSCGRHL